MSTGALRKDRKGRIASDLKRMKSCYVISRAVKAFFLGVFLLRQHHAAAFGPRLPVKSTQVRQWAHPQKKSATVLHYMSHSTHLQRTRHSGLPRFSYHGTAHSTRFLQLFSKQEPSTEPSTAQTETDDEEVDIRTTSILVGGQLLVIVASAVLAYLIGTPNWGLGSEVAFDSAAIRLGFALTVPLGVLAALLDTVEDRFPALRDVSTATQRSVLALMGGKFRPLFALAVSITLGLAAGFGEEMMFRGILQYELCSRVGNFVALGVSSVIFGLLHAVTPLYAALASLASVYFGSMYLATNNLAVAIVCHAVYDVGALWAAHWQVTRLSSEERAAITSWEPEPRKT